MLFLVFIYLVKQALLSHVSSMQNKVEKLRSEVVSMQCRTFSFVIFGQQIAGFSVTIKNDVFAGKNGPCER